ncbi:unnamed protein product [Effrenium voratum]|nr:unnamed protein product [Effrenium voratum]|mmetsp:Transcript_26468/g.63158  ORF Transcript_26468/g.63158 Transcript_26468/m.63158 type:complete len:153 (+) Transcript_26468:71-529(+)
MAYQMEPTMQYMQYDQQPQYQYDQQPQYMVDPGYGMAQPQMMYSQSPYGQPMDAYQPQMQYSAAPQMYSPAPAGLDHGQGKWFAPGEALPPGFMVTPHPEGHTAPAPHHSMTDKARESFVVTGSSAPAPMKTGSSLPSKAKKTKKKKASGCC